jgi:hypothetical protein
LIVIAPEALVMVTPVPAVSVVRVKPVPLPMSNSPLAGVVVRPVPPLATGNAVPDKVIANVPLVVIGDPAMDRNAGTVAATLETVPVEAALDANNLTVPALFLKYSFSSNVFSANSPATKLPEVGTAEAVVL